MKLGASKAAAKKPEAKKAAKPAKRKSRSSGGSSLDGVKTWLFSNIEKMVLGLMGLSALWIIYSGFKGEGLPANNSPNDLEQQLAQASSAIEQVGWSEVESVRYPEPDRFDEQAGKDVVPVKIDDYAMTMPFHPILKKRQKKRTDPELLAPRELEVRAGAGPLAMAEDKEGAEPRSTLRIEGGEERPLPENIAGKYSRGESSTKIESRYFVSVMGLVPIREQWQVYDEAFIGAAEYAPDRDQPIYKFSLIERKDLTAGEKDWTALDMTTLTTESKLWSSQGSELVADKYIDGLLAMDVPPIMGRDMTPFALHSKVETAKSAEVESRETESESEPQETDLLKGSSTGEERRSSHAAAATEAVETGEVSSIATLDSDVKMFRFFDFAVKPGHRYVYRARLVIEDPNNPAEDKTKPSMDACEISVLERRQQTDSVRYPFHRETPWSEESLVITVPHGEMILAGTAIAAKPAVKNSSVKADEPSAKVLAVAWDPVRVVEVPLEVDVVRGSLLNAKKKVEAIDPKLRIIRLIDDYLFATNSLVVDIGGGDSLDARGELRSPGLLLIMDSNGDLNLHSEFEDLSSYESSIIPPAEEELREREGKKEEPRGGEPAADGKKKKPPKRSNGENRGEERR